MTTYLTGAPLVTGAVPAAKTGRTGRAGKADRAGRSAREAREGGAAAGAGEAKNGLRTGEATRAVPSAALSAAPPEVVRPHADCTADSAGGLTFDVRLTAGTPAAQPPGDAALLLRLRGGDDPEDTVRLPLGPAAAEGTLRAVLPSIMSLPEGRWDVCLALGGEEPQRLLPGVHDLRSLIDRVPRVGRTWLGVRIPYATKYGNLTVRSWLRWPHAEAGRLCVADGGMVVRGRFYGARLSATARLEAYPRDAAQAPVSVPLLLEDCSSPAGDADREGAGRAEHAPGFAARLPLDTLPFGQRVWNLWVRPSVEEEPVRLARILDDVPDKKQIFSYPAQCVTGPDGAVCAVRPYYTRDNDLSVQVSCAEAV